MRPTNLSNPKLYTTGQAHNACECYQTIEMDLTTHVYQWQQIGGKKRNFQQLVTVFCVFQWTLGMRHAMKAHDFWNEQKQKKTVGKCLKL